MRTLIFFPVDMLAATTTESRRVCGDGMRGKKKKNPKDR
jgi:hypothetical protein